MNVRSPSQKPYAQSGQFGNDVISWRGFGVKNIDIANNYKGVVVGLATIPPNGPTDNGVPLLIDGSDDFPGGTTGFNTDNSVADTDGDGQPDIGSVYFQHTSRGYTYCFRLSNLSGQMNLWRWNGDSDNPYITTWTEVR